MAIQNPGDISGLHHTRTPLLHDAQVPTHVHTTATTSVRPTGVSSIDIDPAALQRNLALQYGLDIDLPDNVRQYIDRLSPDARAGLRDTSRAIVANWGSLTGGTLPSAVSSPWSGTVTNVVGQMGGSETDVNALVQWVLRESYLDTSKDLYFYAEKVKYYNEVKKVIRDELQRAREAMVPYAGAEPQSAITPYTGRPPITEFMGDGQVRPAAEETLSTKEGLETYIKNLEEKLSSVGDDAQLANVDLQNMLQKQQQGMQMMSNISKMLSDTALAIIRKIG